MNLCPKLKTYVNSQIVKHLLLEWRPYTIPHFGEEYPV